MNDSLIYLDHAATTPVDPYVLEAMLPYFSEDYGNPSSIHQFGQRAEAAVEEARDHIASLLKCKASEIIFTSCGSESDNLALRGMAFTELERRGAKHILTTLVEHHAVLKTAEQLRDLFGFQLEFLETDQNGVVHIEELQSKLRSDTAFVSVIYANNEIGSINNIPDLAEICRSKGIPFHTDAVQAASQLDIAVDVLQIDLMSLGAHKFYGPKGVGLLYVRDGMLPMPYLTGGSQERGLRAGTLNVPLIVGMARALERTIKGRMNFNRKFVALRDRIIHGITTHIPDSRLTGHPSERLPNHASFVFKNVDGNQLLATLDLSGIACSSGSACKTGDPKPSQVLNAIGISKDWALGSLRISVGRKTSESEIDTVLEVLPKTIFSLRGEFA